MKDQLVSNNDEIKRRLVDRATRCLERAYAPYSGFAVGAALLAVDGRVFEGCNVENESLGLTICAERVAVGSAVAAGVRQFVCLVIVADHSEVLPPCGACCQVLAEFCPELECVLVTRGGREEVCRLKDLLPRMPRHFLSPG